ncbi:MAG: hypothetical protein D6706_00240 [Chloroflexi bacterium]|nr:MAG: hypothetical protein D6706_00240 [Chloroflexota bacterium]
MDKSADKAPDKKYPTMQNEANKPALLIANRYAVVHKLSGGMAIVFLCRDQITNDLVALKTFKPEFLSHRLARDLFLREGTMWVELGYHPHIVRAHRVERIGDGREVYLVLEWVVQMQGKDGPSLRSWLKGGKSLDLKDALTFALHITRGMKYATTKIPGLIHRDLKPENVLISHDKIAKVTDFGLASTLSSMGADLHLPQEKSSFHRTQLTQGVVGTPLYMAPEQWLHKPLDARADIYAMGCILYEMITGKLAAYGESKDELREIHLSGRIPPPPPTLPKEVTRFLRKCLMVNRERRFRSWQEVEEALLTVYRQVFQEEAPPERTNTEQTHEEKLAAGHSYNSMGLSYLDIGKLDVAVNYFEQAVWIGRRENSLKLECSGLGNLGMAYTALGYLDRAIEFFEEQLTLAREIGELAEEAKAQGNLGKIYRRMGDAPKALHFHERELALSQELGDRYAEAAALSNLGDTHRMLGDIGKAEEYYKQSLAIAKDIGDQMRVRDILRSMGRIYMDQGEMRHAVTLLKQSLGIAHKMGDRVGEGEVLSDLARLYLEEGYWERAIELFRRVLTISEESKNKRGMIGAMVALGEILSERGDIEAARDYLEAALELANEVKDRYREMEIYVKLGDVYIALEKFMHAANLHKRGYELAVSLQDRAMMRKALLGQGYAYERWGDLGRTIEFFEACLALLKEEERWDEVLNMLDTLGGLNRKIKLFKNAEKAYQEYLRVAREVGDVMAEGDALNKLGEVKCDLRQENEAIDLYKEAQKLAQERKDLVAEAIALGNMGVAYQLLGKRRQAGRYADKGVKLAEKSRNEVGMAWAYYRAGWVLFRQEKWKKSLPYLMRAHKLFVRLGEDEMATRVAEMLAEAKENEARSTGFLF